MITAETCEIASGFKWIWRAWSATPCGRRSAGRQEDVQDVEEAPRGRRGRRPDIPGQSYPLEVEHGVVDEDAQAEHE
jgi:hypothetical protein